MRTATSKWLHATDPPMQVSTQPHATTASEVILALDCGHQFTDIARIRASVCMLDLLSPLIVADPSRCFADSSRAVWRAHSGRRAGPTAYRLVFSVDRRRLSLPLRSASFCPSVVIMGGPDVDADAEYNSVVRALGAGTERARLSINCFMTS